MLSPLPSGYMVLCTSWEGLTQLNFWFNSTKTIFVIQVPTVCRERHPEHAGQFVFRIINHIPLGILENKLFFSEYTSWNIRHVAA